MSGSDCTNGFTGAALSVTATGSCRNCEGRDLSCTKHTLAVPGTKSAKLTEFMLVTTRYYPGLNVASRDENTRLGNLTNVKDSPNKLSMVTIPKYIEEEQVRELVETMGKLNAFVLARALPLLYRRTAQRGRSKPSSISRGP